MTRVAIIHPWFPQYRTAFFKLLIRQARSQEIDLDIFFGEPPPEWRMRGDAVSADGLIPLPTKFVKIRDRVLGMKRLEEFYKRGPYELVIVEQAVRNLETYRLLIDRRGAALAFWGHGRTYTRVIGKSQELLKTWLTNHGDWFFAYTEGGLQAVVAGGFPSDRVSVVQNSIDTRSLQREVDGVPPGRVLDFIHEHDLRGKTALYMGGLDRIKRVAFLLESAAHAYELDSDFRLIVAGAGEDAKLVERAAKEQSWVTYLGTAFGATKAMALAAAQAIAIPGAVGLIAVDSFASALPIVTVELPWHGPEFEYLESEVNAIVTPNNVEMYAHGLVDLLNDDVRRTSLVRECRKSAEVITLEAMVENFLLGIAGCLNRPGRNRRKHMAQTRIDLC